VDTGYGRGVAVIVFDIDGVLADVRHRLHHLQSRPKDWAGFFAAAVDDPVLPEGRRAVDDAQRSGASIIYVTGRPSRYRGDTRQWLLAHGFPEADLHMRPNRDRRPARFYKAEVLRQVAADDELVAVVDDDVKVVEHLRSRGLTVLHATWMLEPDETVQLDLLLEAQESQGRT
jgi:phosphoglycolate phosphatase-like HAD superfamily hydrolase